MLLNRNFKLNSIGALLICLSNFSFCQNEYKNGYIINNNNDTIYGLINLKSNYKNALECNFKTSEEATAENFSPQDIKSYRIEDNKYYISKEITLKDKKRMVFLEFLLHGIVDLYYYKVLDEEYFFIEKDGTIYQLTNEERVLFDQYGGKFLTNSGQYYGILTYLFQNSPETVKKINETKFDYKSLIHITKEYHENICKDYTCIDYTKSTKMKFFMEPEISLIYSRMGLKSSSDFAEDIKPAIGINFRFNPVQTYHVWSFVLGANYSFNTINGDFKNNIWGGNYKIDRVNMKYSILRIPIMFEYTFPTKKIQPFLSAGGNISYINKPSYSVNQVDRLDFADTVIIESDMDTDFERFQIGIQGGIGIRYKIDVRSHIYLRSDFVYREPTLKVRNFLDYHFVESIIMSLGYSFSLN